MASMAIRLIMIIRERECAGEKEIAKVRYIKRYRERARVRVKEIEK